MRVIIIIQIRTRSGQCLLWDFFQQRGEKGFVVDGVHGPSSWVIKKYEIKLPWIAKQTFEHIY